MRHVTAARSEHDETRRTMVAGHRKFPTPCSVRTVDLSEPGQSFTRTNRSTQTQMEKELRTCLVQARFISWITSGEIKVHPRTMKELLQDIIDKGFDPILREGSLPVPDDEGEAAAAGESPAEGPTTTSTSPLRQWVSSVTSTCGIFSRGYLKWISEIDEAMRSSHTDHGKARSGPEAAGDGGVSDSEPPAAAAPRRWLKRSAAESVPMDDDYDEEEAAPLYDYLAAIVGPWPQQHGEPVTVSIQRRPTKKKQRMKSSVVGALLPLEDINIAASASTGTDDAWTSRPAVPYSLSTLGFARSI
ncbi:hypothetical protein VPH35_024688 [Triticum aestivum]